MKDNDVKEFNSIFKDVSVKKFITLALSRWVQTIFHQPEFKQEGHDGPVLLHWLIREIPSNQALQILGNWFKT